VRGQCLSILQCASVFKIGGDPGRNRPPVSHQPPIEAIDSTLFYEERPGLRPRQFVILERNKFDRSPCGTGLSARMAELALQGRLKAGDRYEIENVLGIAFLGEVAADSSAAGRPVIIPRVTGRANLSGFSTLIVEANDPLPDGFLCR
jgi:proline racemase